MVRFFGTSCNEYRDAEDLDHIASQVEKLYEMLKLEKPAQIKLLPPTANKSDDMGYDGMLFG